MSSERGLFYHDESDSVMLVRSNLHEAHEMCVPVQAHKLPLNARIENVGLTHSTVLADFDFETYSEAGYYFDPTAKEGLGQWRIVPGAPSSCPSGLAAVGAVNYAADPTCEILSMSYDLKDGSGSRLWLPWMPPPQDLIDYIKRGGLIAAWNASFEFWVWKFVCHERMGWPELPFWQLRDDMAKAQAFGLPGALANAGVAIKSEEQKQDDGKRLLNKFSKPQNPLKSKPNRRRIFMKDEPEDAGKLCGYNVQDIVSEASIASLCPDLSPHEELVWLCDQSINVRGVQIDLEAVHAFIELVEQAQRRYRTELQQITNGAVETESKATDMRNWCNDRGADLSCLDEDAVDTELAREDLDLVVRRVLEIRQLLSSAAIKKLFAMKLKTGPTGRMHNVFTYCGAQKTGRWAGRDIQPQNLPAKSLKVAKCRACGHIKLSTLGQCITCGDMIEGQDPHPWDDAAVNEVIRTAMFGDLDTFEEYWGDPLTAIAACIRGLLTCAQGNDMICSDFSAIEAVVLAFMSGCQWRMDVFNSHGKIYEMSAAKISGVPFEEMMSCAGFTDTVSPHWWEAVVEGEDHPLRKTIGKVAELACFAPDTKVLTKRGYVRIVEVNKNDFLWDGVEWVTSNGVIPKGERETLLLDGVRVTPEHPVSLKNSWKEAKELASNPNILRQALEIGSENLPSSVLNDQRTLAVRGCSALAGATRTLSRSPTYIKGNRPDALSVAVRKAVRRMSKSILSTQRSFLTMSTDADCAIAYPLLLGDATTPTLEGTGIMEVEGLRCAMSGENLKGPSCGMSSLSKDGTTPPWRWTGKTLTEITNPETLGLLVDEKTCSTNAASPKCKKGSTTLSDVYDIVNAGPRNRFTIKTDTGHLIVHNSGYQGWIGAWKNFGAEKFMSDDEIKKAILKWRDESPEIVEFWGGQYRRTGYRQIQRELYGVEGCAVAAVMNPGVVYEFRGLHFGVKDEILYVRLPSGRSMTYHEPELYDTQDPLGNDIKQLTFMGVCPKSKKWVRRDTYGGRMTENIIQAIARDIQANSIVQLEKAGYSVVLHVHDEIISEVKQGTGTIEGFEQIMSTMPSWCAHWPVGAKGGWRGTRYKKD